MNSKFKNLSFVLVGIVLLLSGLFIVKFNPVFARAILALPYVCIGIGCGLFGHGMGNIISIGALKNSPEISKQVEIDKNDERNIIIMNKSKAKAYDMMVPVFGALLLAFACMEVELTVILLLVAAYLLVVFYGVYYRCKYDKEM
ncbi:hypothetical protein [Acetobacterium tundrae]|uniref:DUF2178 domain-containing protein n=1 Tax=Acetobacterium tundrae TaxID=132932 RepID=A0ABR6WKQ5_9FIRM|nr:hypothetical protein [Acetobacterium tundrae]MBC3796821.1 hypothetical protein [Acetobacterium tundrae]